MTREEAIQVLTDIKRIRSDEIAEAIDMAIEALNNITDGEDLIIKGAKGIQDGLYNIKDGKLFKYKAKGGTVRTYPIVPSAEAEYADLPDIPRAYYERIVGKMAHEISMLKEQLESADAVQGEWIEKYNGNGWNDFWDYTCSNCGKKYERADAVLYHANYCPNCGARMKGGAE